MIRTNATIGAFIASMTAGMCSMPVHGVTAPSFADVLSLRSAQSASISPNGKDVLFRVRTTDWKDNSYDQELWLARDNQPPIQLTRSTKGSSRSGQWSPDGQWIAYLADFDGKNQIYLIRANGGEAQVLTAKEEGIRNFEWSPDGSQMAFVSDDSDESAKAREKRFGAYAVEDKEHIHSHLWLVDVTPDPWPSPAEIYCVENEKKDDAEDSVDNGDEPSEQDETPSCQNAPEPTRLTEGDFTISSFDWSPDGSALVYEYRDNGAIMSYVTADIAVLELESMNRRELIQQPGFDGSPEWSPDGEWIMYQTNSGNTQSDFYTNGHLMKVPAAGGASRRLAAAHDEQISNPTWTDRGIYFTAWNRTQRKLYRLNPDSDQLTTVSRLPEQVFQFSLTTDGHNLAFTARTSQSLVEVYRTPTRSPRPAQLTQMTHQIRDWPMGTSEVISWESKDKTLIEGVLHKPHDFDPNQQYPLLVVTHGGPTGISAPAPISGYVYPIYHWAAKGALILQPNYRGSAGYGEAFRSLNVRNLGVGDMWDVMSGVDHLIGEGMVDASRMGAMGWSQGGYISAFLATNTDRFKAISVGAGISNWMTYYVNTDIHPFTRQYLKGTPWSDPDIYALTSPMTTIGEAKTPTLIQHGELDRRVPTPNAYELYQGLQDVGVETELVIYKNFGHGISKPRERLAAVWHNWQWFARFIWNEAVELPGTQASEE